MSLSHRLAELEATKTCKSGLITIQDYIIPMKRTWMGHRPVWNDLPRATIEQHIIVMKLVREQLILSSVWTDKNPTVTVDIADANNLLFIFVNMKTNKLEIQQRKYKLGDNNYCIDASFDIDYRVSQVVDFWNESNDPLARFEEVVIRWVKNYFLNKTSSDFTSKHLALKGFTEKYIENNETGTMITSIEEDIKLNCGISGIEIIKVYADITLPDELIEYLNKNDNKVYSLKIDPPQGGYRFSDGHHVDVFLDISYKITDAVRLWTEVDSPLERFKKSVINEVSNCFLTKSSTCLVVDAANLKSDVEQQVEHAKITEVKISLENSVKNNCCVPEIEIVKVYADVKLSNELIEHLKIPFSRIYGTDGIFAEKYKQESDAAKRSMIEKMIDNDNRTFYPYILRDVIMVLDIRLLVNFYKMSWIEALQKVFEEYHRQAEAHQARRIDRIKKKIKDAEEIGAEQADIKELKNQLIEELNKEDGEASPYRMEFLDSKMNFFLERKQLIVQQEKNVAEDSCKQLSNDI